MNKTEKTFSLKGCAANDNSYRIKDIYITLAKTEIIHLPKKCGGISSNGFHKE